MKLKINWKKTGITIFSTLAGLYFLFLLFPLILSPVANSYCDEIENIIKVSTGLDAHIDGIGITTSPELTIGVKIRDLSIYAPDNQTPVIELTKAKADFRLLPLLAKKIQIGNINFNEIESNIAFNKSGEPVILKYFPAVNEENTQEDISLPLGLKLSNHLPNIKINNYKLTVTNENSSKKYYIDGKNLKISDFIFDKKIKISTTGEIVFDKKIISKYDIKVFNQIMPDLQLDDLIFPKEVKTDNDNINNTATDDTFNFNILEILETLDKNGIKADLKADIKTSGTFKNPKQTGIFELDGMSVLVNGTQLPESYVKFLFNGKKTDIDSIFYTSSDINEKTHIMGTITSGEKPSINLTLRSNAKINNVIRLIDSAMQSLGMNDLKTVSASGGIDADFNINSDLKTIVSNGHFKIPESSLKYGAYNVSVDNIRADVDLDNNNINIKNIGFSVIGHPLNIKGTISSDAQADIKITADKLSVKGLIGATGQVGLLKDNDFNSGTLSLDTLIKGSLSDIKPDIKLITDNINIYNKSAQARLLLNRAIIKLLLTKDSIGGDIEINNLKIKHDMASVSIPSSLITMNSKDINIKNSYVMINNSKLDVTGFVKDYLNKNINIDIIAKGNLSASDVSAFIPKELKSMFPYTGTMPLSITAKGNDKVQNVTFDLKATPNGYIRFFDIDKLKGKNTNIHTDLRIENNSLNLDNSGIFANSDKIVAFGGGIKNFTNPYLNIDISVGQNISFPIPGMGNSSNITANGSVNVTGNPLNPKLKGKVYIGDISIKDMDFILKNISANLDGQGISGNAIADKMKFGGIIGTNLSSNFSLNNFSIFNLSNIKADAFDGKINGKLTYNIPTFSFGVDLTGKGLNSESAVYGAVGIQKALTGVMGFNAKLNSKGVTDTEIIKNMKGNIDFTIENGRFVSIGRLENLVSAQNITTNSILKSALSALTTAANLEETNKYKLINGKLTLSNGKADINFINVSGPLMSYYVKGIYNILQNSANLVILGRLDSKVVSYLGPLGQLSADKLLSYIPKFGASTAKFLNLLTQDPKNENTALIPELSSKSTSYKDFKVIFNGSAEKPSSVKSFKWLSTCDTTQMNIKQELKNSVQAVKDNVKNQTEAIKTNAENIKSNVNKAIETQKQNIETEKKAIEQAKTDIQNIKQNAGQSAANLGNLLKNAASNANRKMEIPPTKTTPSSETVSPETKTDVSTQAPNTSKTE